MRKIPEESLLNQMIYIDALRMNIDAFSTLDYCNNSDLRAEGRETAYICLSMAQQMEGHDFEAVVHEQVGYFDALTKENYKVGIKHFQKAVKIYKSCKNCRRKHRIYQDGA